MGQQPSPRRTKQLLVTGGLIPLSLTNVRRSYCDLTHRHVEDGGKGDTCRGKRRHEERRGNLVTGRTLRSRKEVTVSGVQGVTLLGPFSREMEDEEKRIFGCFNPKLLSDKTDLYSYNYRGVLSHKGSLTTRVYDS